jgi:ABC-2 type transport system permease protein
MLTHYGVTIDHGLVMDNQNFPFPMMVNRTVGNVTVREVQALAYPYFVDIFPDGMERDHPALRSQPNVTLQWTSPVSTTQVTVGGTTSDVLLNSSESAWINPGTDILPNYEFYPETGFQAGSNLGQYSLAVSIQGVFESYFKGKPSPLSVEPTSGSETAEVDPAVETAVLAPVIEQSAGTARLVVIGGAAFLDDFVLQLSSQISQDRVLNNLLFVQNLVDWSVEDLDLLNIRSRGTYTRVLKPLETNQQTTWEVANYIIGLIIPLIVYIYWRQRRLNEPPMELLTEREIQSQLIDNNPESSETNLEAES